jgi:hypothetical protein
MKTQKKSHEHERPMKITQKEHQCNQEITNKVLKTKMLPCGVIFQKWHPII